MYKIKFSIFILAALWLAACKPDRDDEFTLGDAPGAPTFTVEPVAGDPNKIVITDLTTGSFQRLWDLPGGNPKNSAKAQDTVYYSKKGEYTITLYTSMEDGSGTASASKKITIEQDGVPDCTPKTALLTGDCESPGKSWKFSRAAGAVKVGPTFDDFSWYSSPVDGLQNVQYDTRFWFKFEGQVYENRCNGLAVNPWNGYAVEPYEPGIGDFVYQEGTGIGGADQIILPDNQFIGVRDADNVLTIVKLSATELVVRTRICNASGVPNAEGWFELHFEKA